MAAWAYAPAHRRRMKVRRKSPTPMSPSITSWQSPTASATQKKPDGCKRSEVLVTLSVSGCDDETLERCEFRAKKRMLPLSLSIVQTITLDGTAFFIRRCMPKLRTFGGVAVIICCLARHLSIFLSVVQALLGHSLLILTIQSTRQSHFQLALLFLQG